MEKTEDWKKTISSEWKSRRETEKLTGPAPPLFPLAANPFGEEEVLAMTEVLLSGRLTMGENVEFAEKEFAAAVGAPYAVMVNSGSSANLIMINALLVSAGAPPRCVPGDEVFVPAVCWSTSVAPLLQLGLVPVFVDADPLTMNISLVALEEAITKHPQARALMAVHVLGNSADMNSIMALVRKHNLVLLEDTCESLGSYATLFPGDKPRMLGTFGTFGAFSFFFSHHITSGEGGMVVCQTLEDYNCLRRLRAHGWTRHLVDREKVEAQHPHIDPRFLFVSVGYNVRPLEVQGAMLRVQTRKLEAFNACRRDNVARIEAALARDARFGEHMALMRAAPGTDPAWFGLGLVLHRPYAHQLRDYLVHLSRAGVENRPIISGNFVRQPMVAEALPHLRVTDFPGAEVLHTRGFFIGVHQLPVSDSSIDALVNAMLSFKFKPRRVVLVLGSGGMLGHHVTTEVSRHLVSKREGDVNITLGHCCSPTGGYLDSSHAENDEISTEWVFASRKDGDLSDLRSVEDLFRRCQPTHVLHLAAKLKSLKEMTQRPVDFWMGNVDINNNVLHTAHKFRTWCGPIRVVSVLSTVMFPRDAVFPINAEQSESGSLHPAGEAYALSKRALAALSRFYRTQHGEDFVTVLPGNFFGEHGDFEAGTAPLVNALIAKAVGASNSSSVLSVMGSGEPLRQIMYAGDLARILLWALEYYRPSADIPTPLIVAGPEHSIRDIAKMVSSAVGFNGDIFFDKDIADGPLRRTADTSQFEKLCPDFTYSHLDASIRSTASWYRSHQDKK
jgi:CDP-6-deoxy-D-xylo-4-hexulose-3-dehydrase